MSKSNDVSTLGHRPLTDNQLDTIVGGHKAGPNNYNKKDVTIPLQQVRTNSTPLLASSPWGDDG